jgi:hypothetical protein
MGQKRNVCKILVRKPERRFQRPRHIWEDIIKMDIKELKKCVCEDVEWLRTGSNGGFLCVL